MENEVLIVNKDFFLEFNQMLITRSLSTHVSIFDLCQKISECLDKLDEENIYLNMDDEGSWNSLTGIYINLAYLIKFLYPLMEQLDASIDAHVKRADKKEFGF